MIFVNENNGYCRAMVERLAAVQGAHVPRTLADFFSIYGNAHSDQREIEKRAKLTGGDGSDALHWGFSRYACQWLEDREKVRDFLGKDLADTDFTYQTVDIDEAWSAHDRKVEEKRRQDRAVMTPKEPEDKAAAMWLALAPNRYRDADIGDFGPGAFRYMDHVMRGGSMLMLGGTGVGKTRFIWAIGKALINEVKAPPEDVIITNLQEMLAKVRTSGADWVEEAVRRYGRPVWLFVDECDKTAPNDWLIVNAIVNKRYENGCSTVFVGNGTREQIASKLGEPVVSRLTAGNENGLLFIVEGNDRRNTKK